MHEHDREIARAQDGAGHAAKHGARYASPTVRGHDDRVCLESVDRLEDFFGGTPVSNRALSVVYPITDPFRYFAQILLGLFDGLCLVAFPVRPIDLKGWRRYGRAHQDELSL
jgi:hypothetical protein